MYTCHSGGCPGSDMFWETEGMKYNVITIAYSFYGHNQKGNNRKILEREQLDEGFEHVKIASKGIGRTPNVRWPYVKNLICRNWFQVKNSESVFAISREFLGTEKKIVAGGTGWAVQMAIDNNKPTFVFDQPTKLWNEYDYTTNRFEIFAPDYVPTLTKNFAGIGTRELNDDGKKAIELVLKTNLENISDT